MKRKKPSGKNAKQKSDLVFTAKIEMVIRRADVLKTFDTERKFLLGSDEDEDKLIAKKMNFDTFLKEYLTDENFEWFFYDYGSGAGQKADICDFVEMQLEDYVLDLSRELDG